MEVQSCQVLHYSYYPREAWDEIENKVLESEIELGTIGGGAGVGRIGYQGSLIRNEERYEFDSYELNDLNSDEFESGYLYVIEHSEPVIEAIIIANVEKYQTEGFEKRPDYTTLFLRRCVGSLDSIVERLLPEEKSYGSSLVFRIVPEDRPEFSEQEIPNKVGNYVDSHSELLEHFGFGENSYISYLNDCLITAVEDPANPFDVVSTVDCGGRDERGIRNTEWIDEYLAPLSTYFKLYHWQHTQYTRLREFENELKTITNGNLHNFQESEFEELRDHQITIEEKYSSWMEAYTEISSDRTEIEDLISRLEGGFSPATNEVEVSSPDQSSTYIDSRSLLTRLSSDIQRQYDVIGDQLENLSSWYNKVESFTHNQTQAFAARISINQQKASRRTQIITAALTIVLTLYATAQFIALLFEQDPRVTQFLITAFVMVLIAIIELLLFNYI